MRIVSNAARRLAPTVFYLDSTPISDLGGLKSHPSDELTANCGYLYLVSLEDGGSVVSDCTRIRFYDQAGHQYKVAGRTGSGPGEFQQITSICRTRGDTLVVNDPTNGRVTVLDRTGRFVREIAVGHVNVPWGGGCLDDGTFLELQSASGLDGTVTFQATLRRVDGRVTSSPGNFWSYTPNIYLTSTATLVAHGTRLYYGDPRRSEVRVLDPDGTLLSIIRTDDPIQPVSTYERGKLEPAHWSRRSNSDTDKAQASERARLAPKPKTWPAFGRIAVDASGRLWIEDFRRTRDAPYVYTGFDVDGRMQGKFSVPAPSAPGDPMVVSFTKDGVVLRREDSGGAVHLMTCRFIEVGASKPDS